MIGELVMQQQWLKQSSEVVEADQASQTTQWSGSRDAKRSKNSIQGAKGTYG